MRRELAQTLERLEIPFLLLTMALAVVLVDPRGDFPLNDDWDFALATWAFAETREFQFTPFTAVSLRLQVLWGALWSVILGHSFNVLRASTLVVSATIILLMNRWLKRSDIPVAARLIVCLSLFFHPIFFWASFTYMTQVPYLLMSILSLYLFARGVIEDRRSLVVLAALAVVGSYFIRQTGIVNAVPPLALLLFFRERLTPRWRDYAMIAASPMVLFAPLFLWTDLLAGSPAEFARHYRMWGESSFRVPQMIELAAHYTFFNFQNAALFFLPLVVPLVGAVFWRSWEERAGWVTTQRRRLAFGLSAVAVVCLFLWRASALIARGRPMPYWGKKWCCDIFNGNILINFGLGPPTLGDIWRLQYDFPFALPYSLRTILTIVTAFLGALLLVLIVRSWRLVSGHPREKQILVRLAVVHAVSATAVLFISGAYFDRYSLDSLWSIILIAACTLAWHRRRVRRTAVVLLVLIASFSVLSTQEYLRWNRARWEAVDYARARGVRLEQLDGGYEVNKYLIAGFRGDKMFRPQTWVVDDEYLIGLNRVTGYETIEIFPFTSFLGMRQGAIVLQKKRTSTVSTRSSP